MKKQESTKSPKEPQPELQSSKPEPERIYPILMYHPTQAPDGKKVLSAEQHASMGDGWVESPGLFPKESG